jgi:hypothetical protein
VRDVVDGHYLSLARLRLPEVATAFLAETITTDPLTGEGQGTGAAIGAGLRQLVFVRQIT